MAFDWLEDKAKYVVPGSDNFFSVADPANITGHNGNKVPQQPGVTANGPSSFTDLQKDPVTGLYYDPTTGNVFTSPHPYPENQVVNPNVAQQVASNFQTGQALIGQVSGARKDAGAAASGQAGLIQNLNGVISGSAPSVAGTQLAGTLGGIERTQEALASGQGGANAFAARQAAARNIGAAQQQASQSAATLRAQEVQGAIGAKGGVLANMASNANEQAGQDITGASAFQQLAGKGQQEQQKMNTDAEKQYAEAEAKRKGGIPGLIGSLFA
jgi:hypothetical protein